jgi:hypothetical protein
MTSTGRGEKLSDLELRKGDWEGHREEKGRARESL